MSVRQLAYLNSVFFLDTFVINDKFAAEVANASFIKDASAPRKLMKLKAFTRSNLQIWLIRCAAWALALPLCLSIFGPLQALAQSDRLGNSPNSPIHAFGQVFAQPAGVVGEQLRMVFYRTVQSSSVPGAASIYVNGAYHTSLVAGGYSELCLPVGSAELGVKSVQIGRVVKDNLDTITVMRGEGGQTHYLRVQEAGMRRQLLRPVSATQALQEIQGSREQTHTISRVPGASECVADHSVQVTPVPAPVQSQTITLAADALFAFARSDLGAISTAGRASLDSLVSRLRNEDIALDRVNVVGHADPLGQVGPNERLAQDRAQTVRDYLVQSGLGQGTSPVRISSEGRGAREPVVSHCGGVTTPQAIACHAPNRRVVIEISGARR